MQAQHPLVLIGATLALVGASAFGQTFNPILRYNTIAESMFILNKCGGLTPQRHEWLIHLLELAARPIEGTPSQWEQHDTELLSRFERTYRTVPKEKCAELTRTVDQERKTIPRAK